MRLFTFITEHMDEILVEWDRYALTMTPAAHDMSVRDLRDHAQSMLQEIARDLASAQTAREQKKKSEGTEDNSVTSPAAMHGHGRHADHFTLLQLSAEFRALRATVLRMWLPAIRENTDETMDDMIRFNEAIDQAFAESIVTYSARTAQARDMYDAILGHDLRGPLATMAMSGAMLSKPLTGDRQAMIAESVTRSTRFMAAMVDDLLVLSRIKLAVGIQLRRSPVDVAALCEAAVEDARSMHPGCLYQVSTSGRMDAQLDAVRMHQLLVNLLGNAGQHGAEGRPVLVEAVGSKSAVSFTISNRGERIAQDALECIFDPLTRLNREAHAATPVTTSLGLGLNVAKEIAAAHGGDITVASTDERTTFSVQLPRADDSA